MSAERSQERKESSRSASHCFTLSLPLTVMQKKQDLKLVSSPLLPFVLPFLRWGNGNSTESIISFSREQGEANHGRTDVTCPSTLIKHCHQTEKRISSITRICASLPVNNLQLYGFFFKIKNILSNHCNEHKPVCHLLISVPPGGITSCVRYFYIFLSPLRSAEATSTAVCRELIRNRSRELVLCIHHVCRDKGCVGLTPAPVPRQPQHPLYFSFIPNNHFHAP